MFLRFVVFATISIFAASVGGCGTVTSHEPSRRFESESHRVSAATPAQVAEFCGSCHATPPASSFPREAWKREVARGFVFYHESFRKDLKVPAVEGVIQYYEQLAPVELEVRPPIQNEKPSPITFRRQSTAAPRLEAPAVSYISWTTIQQDGVSNLLFCDMRSGEIRRVDPKSSDLASEVLATVSNPAHVERCDLDGDGKLEIAVAELASLSSGDHSRGAVIRLQSAGDQPTWDQELLASGLGRVSDVQPGDFDGDGKTDLLVAEFGHVKTGGIFLMKNHGIRNGIPDFERHDVDERHGAIHIPVADLNGDQRLDFVALVSQEYESVDAFLGRGDGTFDRKPIFRGDDPAYGSSSIQLADLDADGDLDVVFTNGDTFGSEYLKPYHAIHWLENQGDFPFVDHQIANMVGVQIARAADMDHDNDLDIVAVALMPAHLMAMPQLKEHDSILWLEQVERGKFARHSLEKGEFFHAAVTLADLDQDGDTDMAVGNLQDAASAFLPWMTIWWNLASP